MVARIHFRIILLCFGLIGKEIYGKECLGSSTRLSHINHDSMYQYYMGEYSDCTVITYNLEIVFVKEDVDTSFLDTIEEVKGYILFFQNDFKNISMKNLRLVRGSKSYNGNSIHLENNHFLRSVLFPSLKEIIRGNIYMQWNPKLCFVNSIKWNDVMFNSKSYVKDLGIPPSDCPSCSPGCESCWSEDLCQNIWKLSCADDCSTGCMEIIGSQCCDGQCASGCIGIPTNCTACRNFNDSGRCVEDCPPLFKYNRETMNNEDNANKKYHFKDRCVKVCPNETVSSEGFCVASCPPDSYETEARVCQKCSEITRRCPKVCNVPATINESNIKQLVNCTLLKGDLKILIPYFDSSRPATVLLEGLKALSFVEEVTGQVVIQNENITDLSFLQNLRIVRGLMTRNVRALKITRTSIRSLNLPYLTTIGIGDLFIAENKNLEMFNLTSLKTANGEIRVTNNTNLCYIDNTTFLGISNFTYKIYNNKEPKLCEQENKTCHEECSGGCWGPGNKLCRSCRNINFEGECISSCNDHPNIYAVGDECKRCHSQCTGGCSEDGPENCTMCLNAKDGDKCVERCPDGNYLDPESKCQPCHSFCKNGCSGPFPKLGKAGCNDCDLLSSSNECVNSSKCENEFYMDFKNMSVHDALGKEVGNIVSTCQKCDGLCKTCKGGGTRLGNCECLYVKYGDYCIEECPSQNYKDSNNTCQLCHRECNGCYGPDNYSCHLCQNFRIDLDTNDNITEEFKYVDRTNNFSLRKNYNDDKTEEINDASTVSLKRKRSLYPASKIVIEDESHIEHFMCIPTCPPDMPYDHLITSSQGSPQSRCTKFMTREEASSLLPERNVKILVTLLAMGGFIILCVVVIIVAVLRRQKARAEENEAKLMVELEGLNAEEILTPTKAHPDLSNLRLIKEIELEKREQIGSGAFGTVFKGIWHPESEKAKIPVAIKVLLEGSTCNQHKELLEEARVMASVNHPCCIRILAVCLTRQMMLITPLVVHGSLLDYIRKNGPTLSNHAMLKWATQIARGMNYLECKGIVHRDLAARNILVQGINQIKITDFGLAKLLSSEDESYLSDGGKVPVKWLALESIQHRIYTHKSDVWSYGVTLWELFTYGERPYENINTRDLADHLEMGERLSQPNICTIDVYMVMITCWMVDSSSRPSFQELEMEFSTMSKDPGRFLVISGDKLLRFPSEYSEDNRVELRRQMNFSEFEDFICGEDYLNPADMDFMYPNKFPSGRFNHLASVIEEESRFQVVPDYANTPRKTSGLILKHQASSLSSGSADIDDGAFTHLEAATTAKQDGRQRKSSARYLGSPNIGGKSGEYKNILLPPSPPSEKDLVRLQQMLENDNNNNLFGNLGEYIHEPDDNNYLEPTSKSYTNSSGIFMDNPEYIGQPHNAEKTYLPFSQQQRINKPAIDRNHRDAESILSTKTFGWNSGINISGNIFGKEYYNEDGSVEKEGKVSVISYTKLDT